MVDETIDKFEGPLDLLLHLIKQVKQDDINIFDVNIAELTEKYLEYIESMKSLNLNVDSEYIVMAATLMEIKSRELLPHDEEEEEEDPKEELINRLQEYQKYKEIRGTFKEYALERKEMFSKVPSMLDEFHDDRVKINDDVTLDELIDAFLKFQEKKELDKPLNTVITSKEYSIDEIGHKIISKLKVKKNFKFEDLFEERNRSYVVATFLTILDLTRKGKLLLKQDYNLGEIVLSLREDDV